MLESNNDFPNLCKIGLALINLLLLSIPGSLELLLSIVSTTSISIVVCVMEISLQRCARGQNPENVNGLERVHKVVL